MEIFVERRPGGVGQSSVEDAFADLYNRTYNPLVAYCRRYCPPGYDPEDIAQEALSRAWSSWDRYSQSRPFWPWVATIARRLCVDYWRRDERAFARAGGTAALEPCTQPRPDELSETADECRMALSAFRRLRADHQRIVGLRDIEGWSYEDIARFEGVTVESIRGSLRRARSSLRKSYESLNKTTVPALVPVAAVVRLWGRVRARLGFRMARWQAAMQDTGLAATRLGDALAGLVALSVAVVGMGTPATSVVRANGSGGAGTPAVETDGAGAGAPAGVPSAGTAVRTVGSVPEPVKQAVGGWDKNVPNSPLGGAAEPHVANIESFTPSPDYEHDGTVFAVGTARACTLNCGVLFKSTDRGVTWQARPAKLLNGTELLLSPAYPRDRRIFATGSTGLQVSYDDGASFAPLAPSQGRAVMSPGFASFDPRILLPDAPGWQYRDGQPLPEPLAMVPNPSNTATSLTFAFPSTYAADNKVMLVGATTASGNVQQGSVARCVDRTCAAPVVLSGMLGTPRVSVAHGPAGDVVYAVRSNAVFRSLDGAATFSPVALPGNVTISSETVDARGRLYAVALNLATQHEELWFLGAGSATWTRVNEAGLPTGRVLTLQALSDGTLLVGLKGDVSGIACSRTDGASWAVHC